MTVDSCMKVETTTGQSLMRTLTQLVDGSITMSDMCKLMHPALRGGGNNVTESEVATIIYEAGVGPSLVVCGQILSNVVQGPKKDGEEEGEDSGKKIEEAPE
mgnify:FL=1